MGELRLLPLAVRTDLQPRGSLMFIQIRRKLISMIPVLFVFVGAASASAPAEAAETVRASNQIIEEITVTARKKVERLIDTPVAVAVMTSEEIDRYNTRDLAI